MDEVRRDTAPFFPRSYLENQYTIDSMSLVAIELDKIMNFSGGTNVPDFSANKSQEGSKEKTEKKSWFGFKKDENEKPAAQESVEEINSAPVVTTDDPFEVLLIPNFEHKMNKVELAAAVED